MVMKYNKNTGTISFTGSEAFDITIKDKDGFTHTIKRDGKGYHSHISDRPYCLPCMHFMDVYKGEWSYTEICPKCGNGFGSVTSVHKEN
jgi:hypothetical protein